MPIVAPVLIYEKSDWSYRIQNMESFNCKIIKTTKIHIPSLYLLYPVNVKAYFQVVYKLDHWSLQWIKFWRDISLSLILLNNLCKAFKAMLYKSNVK